MWSQLNDPFQTTFFGLLLSIVTIMVCTSLTVYNLPLNWFRVNFTQVFKLYSNFTIISWFWLAELSCLSRFITFSRHKRKKCKGKSVKILLGFLAFPILQLFHIFCTTINLPRLAPFSTQISPLLNQYSYSSIPTDRYFFGKTVK